MQEKTLKVESSRGANIVDVTGYGPQCMISPVTNEVVVYIPGIPEAVARLPHGARDIIVTRNGALLYRSIGGGVGHAWCDQHLRVASIVKSLDATCRSERGLPVTPVSSSVVVVNADSASPPAVSEFERRVRQMTDAILEQRRIRRDVVSVAADSDPKAAAEGPAVVNRELEAKLEAVERYMESLGAKVLEDKKRVPATNAAPFIPPSSGVEWTQAGGLRDNLVAVSDNPFVRRR